MILNLCASGASTEKWISPNKNLLAFVTNTGSGDDSFDVVSITKGNDLIAKYSLQKNDDRSARYVNRGKWSNDSRFFIFSTLSSGGHSIWHTTTFVFDLQMRAFFEADKYTGPIVGGDFRILPNNILKVSVMISDREKSQLTKYIVLSELGKK